MKRIKMVLYGEPGVGKSVFACHAPKPFFICTDGNYEWLEDFGADPNAHINVQSWKEIKNLISKSGAFDDYETIVLDLTEDAFKWCEAEFCIRNNIEHVSDIGYGKGYDISRNEFFIGISKLLSLDKNIILIMHGLSIVEKDRRGIEHTKYVPSSRIPDKVLDMIEGRVRYFLRAYLKEEVVDKDTTRKMRCLSLVPKSNEYGIIRGVDENAVPQDIVLDWNEFINIITNSPVKAENVQINIPEVHEDKRKTRTKSIKNDIPISDITPSEEINGTKISMGEDPHPEEVVEDPMPETPVKEQVIKPVETAVSNEDKIAAIKAKLAALNKKG